MNFEKALGYMKRGMKFSRQGWNGTGMCVYISQKDRILEPFFILSRMIPVDKWKNYTWVPSVSDLFANDWYLVEGELDECDKDSIEEDDEDES